VSRRSMCFVSVLTALFSSVLSGGMYLTTVVSAATVSASLSCVGLSPPLEGDIVDGFRPIGLYEGHWGVDYQAVVASENDVRAAASGVVTFSGVVVGNRTVTVDHGGGLKTATHTSRKPLWNEATE
jgi:murein DD-endopeptidase MepM/ murein hydrolase activator NlpD